MVFTAKAQSKASDEISNADKFSANTGSLIQKEFVDIGKIKTMNMQIVRLKDLITEDSISALRLEYKPAYESDTKIASLDSDEIESLINAIIAIQEITSSPRPKNYTEISYKSRGGFEAGCYLSDKGLWVSYLKLEKYDRKSYFFLKEQLFEEFLELLQKAKSYL